MNAALKASLENNGYAIVPSVLTQNEISLLANEPSFQLQNNAPVGIRSIVQKSIAAHALAHSPAIRSLVEPVLGAKARLVRSILFNKNRDTNWNVTWHQDLSIAVRSRFDISGFVAWSEKEGVPHVQPPPTLLEQMLTVRIHLDDANANNGALWVAPGSHRCGRIRSEETTATVAHFGQHLCAAQAGDVLLMRPLLLHTSRKTESDVQRRVIHLEFSGFNLPAPLE
ncbi:MAG: phytanoyl-CoA dioxygenase family protein, partial [Proteobacteria bacterium]|nr:phytanoyl-CoA dioxygenase family protein [Pseudomonadota bacterium]